MGRRLIDLTGKKFGYLTVLELDKEKSTNIKYWKCQCECGTIKSIQGGHLKDGTTTSCGCHRADKINIYNSNRLINLIGKKFGKLEVLSEDKSRTKQGKHYWFCKCECGNIVSIKGDSLRDGRSKSCGCIKSYGEEKIISILQELNINFITQKTFPGLVSEKGISLRIDFYLPDLKTCIEYNGVQHYKAIGGWSNKNHLNYTQEHDKIKEEYFKNSDIKLIIISYKDFNKLNTVYLKDKLNILTSD